MYYNTMEDIAYVVSYFSEGLFPYSKSLEHTRYFKNIQDANLFLKWFDRDLDKVNGPTPIQVIYLNGKSYKIEEIQYDHDYKVAVMS